LKIFRNYNVGSRHAESIHTYPVKVAKIITEVDTKDIKTFRFEFVNEEDEAKFAYIPGQFGELSIFGKGESPIGLPRRRHSRGT